MNSADERAGVRILAIGWLHWCPVRRGWGLPSVVQPRCQLAPSAEPTDQAIDSHSWEKWASLVPAAQPPLPSLTLVFPLLFLSLFTHTSSAFFFKKGQSMSHRQLLLINNSLEQ